MQNPRSLRLPRAALWLTALVCAAATPVAAAEPVLSGETRQQGSATLWNVPPVPAAVSDAVQRFQNSRAASFQGWLADGSMLIATRFGETQQLHHLAAPGAARTQLTFAREPVASAAVIPGTSQFIMVRDTGGDEWFQLYARGLTGTATRITEPGTRNGSPVFRKDGQMMVWSRATKGTGAYSFLAANPLDGSQPRVIFTADGAAQPADLSADGAKLLWQRGLSNRESQLNLLDIASGTSTRIAADAPPARYEDARLHPDGRRIIAISDRNSDTRRLVAIDIASGRETLLADGRGWDVEGFELAGDGRTVAYVINEEGYSRLRLLDLAGGRALPLPAIPDGVLTGLGFAPDGRSLAFSLSGATSAGDVWSIDLGSGALARWTSSELGELDPAALSVPALVRYPSFDGRRIPAFVYRPKGVAAGVRTPVIIDIHGGPEAQSRPGWNPGAQYFADVLGATVILPNVRGSDGYGKAWLNLDNAEKREDSVKDIGALLDWIGSQPDLDPARVAVYGQSYGGYMSLAAMTHYSDRLVGGVNRYGISDFITFLERTEAYRRDNRRAEYGDERDPKMRAVFQRIAPAANVGRISKPMLVMQGANDPRVPQFESDQIVARLQANGQEVWYVLFADEGHGFLKKPNNDLRREVETLFLQKLFRAE